MGLRIQDSSEEIFKSYGQTGRSSLLSFTQSFDFDSGDRLFDREPWKSAWIQAFTKTNLNPNSLGMDSRWFLLHFADLIEGSCGQWNCASSWVPSGDVRLLFGGRGGRRSWHEIIAQKATTGSTEEAARETTGWGWASKAEAGSKEVGHGRTQTSESHLVSICQG